MDNELISAIKSNHKNTRVDVVTRQINKPIGQLIDDFIIEMDAKNTAYYFILENGLLEQFSEYCKTCNLKKGVKNAK